MEIKYLHESMAPILPAIGDVRFLPEYNLDEPCCSIKAIKCVKYLEHHVVFEDLKTKENIAVPYETVERYGLLSIDEAIKHILNSYMLNIIDSTKENLSYDVFSIQNGDSQISKYYGKLKDLVLLSRQALKEAEKTKNLYEEELEKERK